MTEQFTKVGTIQLNVISEPITERHMLLEFRVTDTGCGMNADQISRLFVPYSQAKLSTYRLHGGTGLGLSISKHLAMLMGGDLTVTSVVNQGSCFTFVLPVETTIPPIGCSPLTTPIITTISSALSISPTVVRASSNTVLMTTTTTTTTTKPVSILIVDDNVMIRKILGTFMRMIVTWLIVECKRFK